MKKRASILSRLRRMFILLVIATAAFVGYNMFEPDIAILAKQNPTSTAFMKLTEERWAADGRKAKITRLWSPLGRISPYLVSAVVIAEDDRFFEHEGFDYNAIKEAIERDIKERKAKLGASTISQQLVKNLWLSPSKNPLRKLREAVLTWRLERELSKRRILEIYLNVVEWGDGIFGAEAAARHYFGKSAADLTSEEAARLAVVLPAPRRYDPTSDTRFITARWNAVHDIMVKRGIVELSDLPWD